MPGEAAIASSARLGGAVRVRSISKLEILT
jgi:hypothetical protein